MCRIMEDLWKEASEKTKLKVVMDMLKREKLSREEAAEYLGVSKEELDKLLDELKAS